MEGIGMAYLINGKKISQDIKDELKEKVSGLKEENIVPTLAVIQVGDDNVITLEWALRQSIYQKIQQKKSF